MSYNIDKQEKLYYKNKVSDIISSYEKQKEEEQKQKMLMKKQLMMSIMNNRQKSQIDTNLKDPSETTKQEKSAKTISHQEVFFDQQPKQRQKGSLKSSVYNQKPTYVPEEQPIQELKHSNKIQQITFNGKKRNKSLEEQLNFKESYLNLLKERRQKQQQQQQQELNKSKLKQKMQVQKATYNVYSSEEQQEQNKKSQISKNPSKYEMKDKTNIPYSKSQYPYQEEEDNQYQVNPSQASNQEQNHGVFLTMEQSESMVAEDPPKNYAFQIKNNKSVDPQSFEELKRIKIKQIQRKRQERIQQFRRNQSQKKVQMPRGRSSYGKKIEKECLVEPQGPPTQIIERKSNNTSAVRKIQPKNERQSNKCIPLQPKDSQVSAKSNNRPNPSAYQQSRPPTYKQIHQNQYQQRQIKPLSPHKTPQTIRSQNRGKSSNNRNNIFQGQNQPRQKSSTKYTEPRIQPKDRKNSFNKQSNKKLMVNAINSVIFPGQLNRKQRQKFVQILQSSPFEFFIFLFKEYSRKMIKGIYVFDSTQTYLKKIYGDKSPSEISSENVQQFYRFDSGSREFKKLDGCKSFSLSIHAIDLKR